MTLGPSDNFQGGLAFLAVLALGLVFVFEEPTYTICQNSGYRENPSSIVLTVRTQLFTIVL